MGTGGRIAGFCHVGWGMFCLDVTRLGLGFTNPNHAAAALCALLPLCWGWRRHAWLGYSLAAALFTMLLLTQSRTGILVAGLEAAVWWWFVGRRGDVRRVRPAGVDGRGRWRGLPWWGFPSGRWGRALRSTVRS